MQKTRANSVIQAIDALYARLQTPLTIIETGSIRSIDNDYQQGDGWSTYYIAKYCETHPQHTFISIDLSIRVARGFLATNNLLQYCTLMQGDSRIVLYNLLRKGIVPHIAYLDSANDASLIMEEFTLVEQFAHTVIVDDVDSSNPELKKGIAVLPYVKQKKYRHQLMKRQLKIWLK